jgi:hypothetical protein
LNVCQSVIERMLSGGGLTEVEKAHLAECCQCMKAIVDGLAQKSKTSPGSEQARSRPAAKQVLERAYRVFEREFGISLWKGIER